jgi:NAD(P)-dependent dehydrogenase (short-subunit alcohol dehydrogenase family)
MKKIALLTGCSSGVGLHAAIQLAQADYAVVATMRNTAKSQALLAAASNARVEVDVKQLDVQDTLSINTCVQAVLQRYGCIDLLVNNAGSGFLGALEETTEQELNWVMDVNFFGVWRVTQAVFPHMRVAQSGRIVTVSSVGGLIGQPFNDAYCAAKFAVEGFMESLAPVAKRVGVQICVVEPGPINTSFVATVQKTQSDDHEKIPAYGKMRAAYMAAAEQAFATIGQSGADVAKVIVEAATVATPQFRYGTSELVRSIIARKYVDITGDSIVALTGARLP